MKNGAGAWIGFVLGTGGFLFIFKFFFLAHIPREDEVPPGIVVLASLLNGLLFAYAGQLLQNYFEKKKAGHKPT